MNPLRYLEKRIRGWLPKEPNLTSFRAAAHRRNVQSRKIKFPIAMVLMLSFIITMSIIEFSEGNATGAFFLWLSCVLGLSLTLDILTSHNKELNEKLMAAALLVVISLGGILANLYIFSMPTSFFTRIFSLSVFILIHVPLLIAVIAYVRGKKELSRKLIGGFSARS
jgi:peptidoglycan/LPS O-acetylase OafA/YrhL